MAGPFPGMDPYLEDPVIWPDVHNALSVHIREELEQLLSPRYAARLEVRYVTDFVGGSQVRVMYPDVDVIEHMTSPALFSMPAPVGTSTAVAAPPRGAPLRLQNVVPVPEKLITVQIRDVRTKNLVSIIEVLSPVNKRAHSAGRAEYLQKREALLQSRVHIVELDLLRGGERLLLADPLPEAAYFVFLSRADEYPTCEVWPLGLRDPLPVVPVPLLAPDPDVLLDLGRVLDEVYRRSGYARWFDYRQPPPPPPLPPADAAWLDERLREAGRR